MPSETNWEYWNDAKQEEADNSASIRRCSNPAGTTQEAERVECDRLIGSNDSRESCKRGFTAAEYLNPRASSLIRNPNALVSIYTLADPRDGQIRYVGQTINPHGRFSGHKSTCLFNGLLSPKDTWLREIYDQGLEPIMTVTKIVCQEKASIAERQQMFDCIAEGCDLTNAVRYPFFVFTMYIANAVGEQGVVRIGLRWRNKKSGKRGRTYIWKGTVAEKESIVENIIRDAETSGLRNIRPYVLHKIQHCLQARRDYGHLID